jgi:hypothetical protein
MFVGAVMTTIGVAGSGDVANLAGGYGLMVMGSALYLLAGLRLRERLAQRTVSVASAPSTSVAPSGTVAAAGRS